MNKNTITFLKIFVVSMGIFVLGFMLFEPHIEGRNVDASLFEIYFQDPFLAYAYLGSIAFFVALYQIFKLLGYAKDEKIFSSDSLRSLRVIKNCGAIIIVFVLGAFGYLFALSPEDDVAGGIFMGLIVIAVSGLISITARKYEGILENK